MQLSSRSLAWHVLQQNLSLSPFCALQLVFACIIKACYLCLQLLGIFCQASCRCSQFCLVLASVWLFHMRKFLLWSTLQIDLHGTNCLNLHCESLRAGCKFWQQNLSSYKPSWIILPVRMSSMVSRLLIYPLQSFHLLSDWVLSVGCRAIVTFLKGEKNKPEGFCWDRSSTAAHSGKSWPWNHPQNPSRYPG